MKPNRRFSPSPQTLVPLLWASLLLGGVVGLPLVLQLSVGGMSLRAEEQLPFPEETREAWENVETLGEEGEWVEVIYDDGWILVGERGLGTRVYHAPDYEVPIRKWEDIPQFPCSDCHNKREIDYTPRAMVEKHENLVMNHGNDRLWCTDCHDGAGLDYLVSRRGQLIDMDLGYLQCGECHFAEFKDWEFGAHGKRIGLWNGPRVLRTCTECHNAHAPQIAMEEPDPPPLVREDLQTFAHPAPRHPPVWERVDPDRGESP